MQTLKLIDPPTITENSKTAIGQPQPIPANDNVVDYKKGEDEATIIVAAWNEKSLAQLNNAAFKMGTLVGARLMTMGRALSIVEFHVERRFKYDERSSRFWKESLVNGAKSGATVEDVITKVKRAVEKKGYEDDTIDAEALLAMDFPALSYVIPGYVVEGLTVLGGKPKLGKSWWAYDAGIAVSTGGRAMGAVQCEQGDVLYLALEDNYRRVKDRINIVCPTRKILGIDLSRFKIRTTAPRIDDGLLSELDKWRLASSNPRLIIIDVYMKVRPPRKSSVDPYAADYEAVLPLQKYASEHRLAVVLVTHTRKMEAEDPLESISGTNGVTGAADAVLVLNRDSKGTTLYGRGRDIEEIETAMKFDGGRWSILGDADLVRKSDERRKILSALKDSDEAIAPKAISEISGLKGNNVRVLLGKMIKDGEVQNADGLYSLPTPITPVTAVTSLKEKSSNKKKSSSKKELSV